MDNLTKAELHHYLNNEIANRVDAVIATRVHNGFLDILRGEILHEFEGKFAKLEALDQVVKGLKILFKE